ncbi:MAG: pentapeptide repeat-containing protein [Caldilineaceae bacterium]
MSDNYQNAKVRGRRFRGTKLDQANFAGADIRGADFTGASLRGADLHGCQCGLRRWWSAGLGAGILLAALAGGAMLGYAAAMPPASLFILGPNLPEVARPLIVIVTGVVMAAPFVVLLRRGIGPALGTVAALAGLAAVGAIFIRPVSYSALNFVVLVLLGAAVAAVVCLACAIATLVAMTGKKWSAVLVLVCAALAAAPALVEGIRGWNTASNAAQAPATALHFGVGAAFALLYLGAGYFAAAAAQAGNPDFGFVARVATGVLTRGGTKFRDADLTGCDFTGADLDHTDLRSATMTRSNWKDAVHLERARVEHTPLQDMRVRRLAVTRMGKDQALEGINLQGMYLAEADLRSANLQGANLIGANLHAADLTGAMLAQALLYDADLTDAVLTGACIEDWGISGSTQFGGVTCAHIYMRAPTREDRDPQRKPDNQTESFAPGDFADFILPIMKTHDLYYKQDVDMRTLATAFKSLDLFRADRVDPRAGAVALTQLAERHPDADLQLVAVEAHGAGKLRLETTVAADADRTVLSEEFDALYRTARALPPEELAALLEHRDQRIRELENLLRAAGGGKRFYVETKIVFGASVKCLLIAANPEDTMPLRINQEMREIMEKLQESKYRDVLEIIPVPAARPKDVLVALSRHQPQIVHFSGHGTDYGAIVLEDDQGNPAEVPAELLVQLFEQHKASIRLVVLNACYAENQAAAIVSVIDTAIGMHLTVNDKTAILFAAAFYRALGFGCSIQAAFKDAILALRLEENAEAATPRLLVRNGVDADTIVFVAPQTL